MALTRMDDVLVVVEDLDAVIAFLVEFGAECEDLHRLCHVRDPEGIVVGLAEELRQGS
ncbi:hypothetical protein [Geodermatophilus nigrescens]|uniref:VOC domain-containing protein n=1 Tax=Geodermatophilus nigrescens TaxID=1070870 RepID=A0A1M5LZL6_9ACTN|nr:hypothetical protein [Geodermatophilus nigrescens]SHG70458.1 hypothetical protein SAMN05444351_2984 [Geodermatophilus nigrescens]